MRIIPGFGSTTRLAALVLISIAIAGCGGGGEDADSSAAEHDMAQTAPVQAPEQTPQPPPESTPDTSPAPSPSPDPTPTPVPVPVPVPAPTPEPDPTPDPVPAPPADDPTPVPPPADDPVEPAPPVNHAPTISGSGAETITAGQAYAFTPVASDADGDALHFSIVSKPSWASFDPATGRLSGVPTSEQAGSYEEIQIIVSDGKASASTAPFIIQVLKPTPVSQSVTLSWQPPTTNSDGSVLTDLSGYRIRYGTRSGTYSTTISISNPGLTSYVIEDLAPGTYYFIMVSLNGEGVESQPTRELQVDLS